MKTLLMMIFSTMALAVTLTMAGCASQELKVNELKTNDGDIYYREGVVLNTCYARAKKDVIVNLDGIKIKACEVTRAYSQMGPPTTSIFEIDCSKVRVSKGSACD